MSDAVRGDVLTPRGDVLTPVEESSQSALSWAAIFAGGIGMAALSLLLGAVGSGVGLLSASPWPNSGASLGTFQVATGIYLIVVAMLSSTIGGYVAGRLRTRWVGVHSEEVLFRDTAHGFLAWAFAALLGAAALGAAATYLGGSAATGAAEGASREAGRSTAAPTGYYVDLMLRPAVGATAPAMTNDLSATRAEVDRVLVHGVTPGSDFSPEDRAYLAQLVSASTGLSQADAEKRVSAVIDQTRAAVDKARNAAGKFSLWLAASMLVGAFSASLAAIEGGQLRDGRWKGVIGAGRYQASRRI